MVSNDERPTGHVARVRKYRAAIAAARMRASAGAGVAVSLQQAIAVVALADAEQAELRAKVAQVEELAAGWEAAAVAEGSACPDGACGTCTQGNLSQILRAALDAE